MQGQQQRILIDTRGLADALTVMGLTVMGLTESFHAPQADKITAEIRRWAREECDLVDNRYALYAWVTGFTENTCTVTINVRAN